MRSVKDENLDRMMFFGEKAVQDVRVSLPHGVRSRVQRQPPHPEFHTIPGCAFLLYFSRPGYILM
jgi:hypothetical protein